VVTWTGTLGRAPYAAVGTAMVLVKFGLDRLLAAAFDRRWGYADYWSPSAYAFDDLPRAQWAFYAALAGLALPFALVGLSLTLRRLRDGGLPPWLVVLFFVPVVNLVFFVVLCLVPARGPARPEAAAPSAPTSRGDRAPASAIAGVVLTGLLGVALVAFATEGLGSYGWGVFVGVPFCLGLLSVLVYAGREPRRLRDCISVGLLANAVATVGLLAVALEGAVCIVMAFPLAAPLGALGALTGYHLRRPGGGLPAPPAVCGVLLMLPAMMGMEASTAPPPAVRPVTTAIVVDAPPAAVWKRVIAFPPLDPPREALFRAGIAYPVAASIDGSGVGAVRRCVFSTGAFVEPITAWDAPRRLAFSVAQQPASMEELSPWGEVRPPHLDGFLRSHRGEFRLEPLPGGRTRLTGTTWYENRMWPARYWRVWSDEIMHAIHRRVLEHVARTAEADESG